MVTVYAKVGTATGILRIMKSSKSTNAGMKHLAFSEIIFNPTATYNVAKEQYVKYTAGFTITADESKYVGFQIYSSGGINKALMLLDDISIMEYDTRQPENYCVAGGKQSGPTPSSYISNVTLNTLNQNNTFWGGYRSYGPAPAVSATLIQNNSYS